MGLAKVNLEEVVLDWPLDEAGFRHVATAVGERLGAHRIGAGVYEAEAGFPIWPYHFHHGIEEWLYVIAGEPVLRDPAGERALAPGELVRFPTGPDGAHTVEGPGRFVIFATGQHDEPWLSVYPDSDKVSGPEGIFVRGDAVGYWHGEGTAGAMPPEPAREPEPSPPRPPMLDATRIELAPGEAGEPYHYVHGRESWLLVLAGSPTLRHPDGEDELAEGDLVCRPDGPAGGSGLVNRSGSPARVLVLSTIGFPANVCHPDTGRWLIRNAPGADGYHLRAE